MPVDTAGEATAGTSLPETHRKPWGAEEWTVHPSHGVGSLLTHRRFPDDQVRRSQHNPVCAPS